MLTGVGARRVVVLVVGALLVVAGLGASRAAAAPRSAPAPRVTGPTGSTYVPEAPDRLLDTTLAGTSLKDVQVSGTGGTPVPADATAVVLNVTASASKTNTFVTVYPTPSDGSGPPRTSAIDIAPGETNADLVTVPLGAEGRVRLYQPGAGMRLIVDLEGYYVADDSDGPTGSLYVPRTVARAFDRTVAAGSTTTFGYAELGVPADATAVAINLGAASGTANTYLTAYPAGTKRPTASALDVARGASRANLAIVPLGGNGLNIYDYAGSLRIFGDVDGWYVPDSAGATGSRFVALTPTRIVAGARLGAGGATGVQVSGSNGVPAAASAAVFTLTAANASAATYETAWPNGASRPTTSVIDAAAGTSVPNLVMTPLSSGGAFALYNDAGTITEIVDLSGYFVADPAGHDVSFNQCADGTSTSPSPLPATAFGVINPTAQGFAFSGTSTCLPAEHQWAAASGSEAFYVPLADLGTGSANYTTPPFDDSPRQCPTPATDTNADCAYEYGWNQAESAWDSASSVDGDGTSHEKTAWWLDVEDQDAHWTHGATAMSQSQNVQVIVGAHDFLAQHGATSVGLYSNADDTAGDRNWPAIVGASTQLAAYPEWIATHATVAYAVAAACAGPAFATGAASKVVLRVQAAGGSVDTDLAC